MAKDYLFLLLANFIMRKIHMQMFPKFYKQTCCVLQNVLKQVGLGICKSTSAIHGKNTDEMQSV
jgi:hypothetical protein